MPGPETPLTERSVAQLIERAAALAGERNRQILGVAGAPGSGKTTVAELIAAELGERAAIVEMDAFHLSDELLVKLGRRDRKGAPDTFDVDGYIEILRRLGSPAPVDVFVPIFDRTLDTSMGSAQLIPADCPLIITTGNYLLLDSEPWSGVRRHLDHAWFLEPDEDQRVDQLIARHVQYGKSPDAALTWVMSSDQRNATVVQASRNNADWVLRVKR